ncbi:putative DNA helicase ino80 [Sporothrix stenoceras]|uniref:DNA helicase ino80 n=1 Tax=Sporothrix stenoceras TaxID=5173 RepID=A0ABR3ZBW2_9PEZI
MDNFHSTVLGRSSDNNDSATANGSNGGSNDRSRRRAIDILNPEPEQPAASASPYPSRHQHSHSHASSTASSSHRAHDTFALRSPTKQEFRPLASPTARQASPASVGPAVNNLLNNSPPLQHRPPPSSVSRSRSPHLAPPPGASAASTPYSAHGDAPREKGSGKFYDPTTDTTTATAVATGTASSADPHTSDSRSRRDNSQVSFFCAYLPCPALRILVHCALMI